MRRVEGRIGSAITPARLLRALARRGQAIPHNIAYAVQSRPGSENHRHLLRLHNAHRGERCFIIGNGPSLAKVELERLNSEYSFGLNRIFLLFEATKFRPSYFVCTNDLVIEQSREEIAGLPMACFVNWRTRKLFGGLPNFLLLRESYRPHFSKDLSRGVWGGATVTFVALQIAYYMGFDSAILIGVDHSYSSLGTPHSTVTAQGPDPDHFDPRYFSDGFRWQLPDLATSEAAYEMARTAFESDGRMVIDATVGGKLNVFPKHDFEDLL